MFERPFLIVLFAYAWSGRRDSDPRLSPWQGDTLPLSHSRKHKLLYQINRQKATIFRYKNKKFFGFTFINCRFSNLLYIVCFYGIINVLPNADVVELADTQDLGSCTRVCRFDSCHPHQLLKKRTLTGSFFNRWLVDGFATMFPLSANFVCNLHSAADAIVVSRSNRYYARFAHYVSCHPHQLLKKRTLTGSFFQSLAC